MDKVQKTSEPVLTINQGKPAAKLVPASGPPDIFGYVAGKVKIVGDIIGPVTPVEDWDTD
jgi:hypothetical protein